MKLSDIVSNWTPARWDALVMQYVPEQFLSGRASPCPVCGGRDRFTYDNRRGRGDWVCRKCDNGAPMAGDGILLVCRVTGMSFAEVAKLIKGSPLPPPATPSTVSSAGAHCNRLDSQKAAIRIGRIWSAARSVTDRDPVMSYLASRVPGLSAPASAALRHADLDYWHDGKVLGRYPAMLAAFTLPDGRVATLHRTFLDPTKPAKATVVTEDGEILSAKRNEVSALPTAGGAVRLMAADRGEIGVAEGIETAYAAHMLSGVPTWSCLNRVLLSRFQVPRGMGIHTIHIFADFDEVDARTGRSPGMADALALQKRLRAEGFKAILHRPLVRGTDFCDQWLTACRLRPLAAAVPLAL